MPHSYYFPVTTLDGKWTIYHATNGTIYYICNLCQRAMDSSWLLSGHNCDSEKEAHRLHEIRRHMMQQQREKIETERREAEARDNALAREKELKRLHRQVTLPYRVDLLSIFSRTRQVISWKTYNN